MPYWVDEDDEDSKIFYDGDDKDYETPDGYVRQVISIPLDNDCRAESDELGSSNIIPEICEMESDFTKKADYEFIAHARTDIPALLDYIAVKGNRIAKLESAIKDMARSLHDAGGDYPDSYYGVTDGEID